MTVTSEGEIDFIELPSAVPVDEFPHDTHDLNEGAITIMEKPARKNGKAIPSVYIAGADPYDHDKSTTMSLGSMFIMNKVTGKIVAEYTGRPDKADEYWEQARLLLLYYDARVNYENDLIGFRNHLRAEGCDYLMVDNPDVVRSLAANSVVDRDKGTHASTRINNHARTLISIWLKSKVFDDQEIRYVHTLESKPLIQELIDWDPDGNYDRVSALGMLMILMEDTKNDGTSYSNDDDKDDPEFDEAWDDIMMGKATKEFDEDEL
jgi:hypothetical protein